MLHRARAFARAVLSAKFPGGEAKRRGALLSARAKVLLARSLAASGQAEQALEALKAALEAPVLAPDVLPEALGVAPELAELRATEAYRQLLAEPEKKAAPEETSAPEEISAPEEKSE